MKWLELNPTLVLLSLLFMQFLKKLIFRIKNMKNRTILLTICWVLWVSQILALTTLYSSLPDLTPSSPIIKLVDTNELKLEAKIEDQLDGSLKNATSFVLIDTTATKSPTLSSQYEENPSEVSSIEQQTQDEDEVSSTLESPEHIESITEAPLVNKTVEQTETNLTEEEIPVFSEWAQKQMAAVEEKQKKDEENASITMAANQSNQKLPVVKLRAKNYASPDCGAKILAANSDSQSTGNVLTASKDEYLLSPCTSRIWFVVELCEAIQAEKIDLANFELFSSSPKEFTVSVSNRFPTRDWNTVGQFTATDERNIQTFTLNPQLYGKFVRVDIHSHYNSEHYCPVSLFRVYGTSEMEALETENQPLKLVEEFDDDDDAIMIEEKNVDRIRPQGDEKNLLKTAGEAVMNIVKKAAEVLNKSNGSGNAIDKNQSVIHNCVSLTEDIQCNTCSQSLNASVDFLLKCKQAQLIPLLQLNVVAHNLLESKLCANYVDLGPHIGTDITKWNYVTVMLPLKISVALCNLIRFKSVGQPTVVQPFQLPYLTTPTPPHSENFVTPHPNDDHLASFNKGLDASSMEGDVSKVESPTDDAQTDESSQCLSSPETSVTEPQDTDSVASLIDPTPPTPPDSFEPIEIPPATPLEQPPPSISEMSNNEEQVVKITETFTESPEIIPTTVAPSESELNLSPKDWESDMEKILNEQLNGNGQGPLPSEINPTTPPSTQKGQPESVFLRLSNRIKALERNMSLSGQYLEELSRRYKKQVEELQQSFVKTLSQVEDQNRKYAEREQQLFEQNLKLRHDINELMDSLHNWKAVILYVGAFVCIQVILLFMLLRHCARRNAILMEAFETSMTRKGKKKNKDAIKRRSSVDGSTVRVSPAIKTRRPSEEALNISGTYEDLLIAGNEEPAEDFIKVEQRNNKKKKDKNRKTSVGSKSSKRSSSSGESMGSRSKLIRADTAPAEYDIKNGNIVRCSNNRIEELPFLEDNDEFIIPTASELSYNEFVPSQDTKTNGFDSSISDTSSRSSITKLGKSRRLSSPAFLKTALSRSSMRRPTSGGNTSLPTVESSSGWEWWKSSKDKSGSNKKRKAKSESPELNTSNVISLSTSSDQGSVTSGSSKKKGGSFRRMLNRVF